MAPHVQAMSVPAKPSSFDQIKRIIGIDAFKQSGQIPTDLREEAQCGGWDFEDNVGQTLGAGKVAKVSGLPGREGEPLGQIESGMAKRNDDTFLHPGDVPVCGYRSACRPYDWLKTGEDSWWPNDPAREARSHPPFYAAHPCQRPLGSVDKIHTTVNPPGRGPITFTCGDTQMPVNGTVCPLVDSGNDPGESGGGLCWYLNNYWNYPYYEKSIWVDKSCNFAAEATEAAPGQVWSDMPGKDSGYLGTCMISVFKEGSCYEKTGEEIAREFPTTPPLSNQGNTPLNFREARQCCTYQGSSTYGPIWGVASPEGREADDEGGLKNNCMTCTGENCRYCESSQRDAGTCDYESPRPMYQYYPIWGHELEVCKNTCTELGTDSEGNTYCVQRGIDCKNRQNPPRRGKPYRSYFRHYTGGYYRAKVKIVETDDNMKANIPVSCYGLYYEFDPKSKIVERSQKRCVIAAYYPEKQRNFWEMGRNAINTPDGTQTGKGNYASDMEDIQTLVRRSIGEFDETKMLWDPRGGNAISFTNSKIVTNVFDDNITMVLYQKEDGAELNATIQLGRLLDENGQIIEDSKPATLSSGALLRATDDTVHTEEADQRTIVEWWQKQETELNTLTEVPAVHLIVPPAWSIGLDPLDPLFIPQIAASTEEQKEDPRMQALDVQLEAREDLIDDIKSFLKRTLLPTLEEEPVPIVIPLGSATDFRAIAEGWQGWIKMQQLAEDGGDGTQIGKAEKLVEMLEIYARRTEAVRQLRGEMLWFNKQLLERQRNLTTKISDWLNDDIIADYEDFREQLEDIQDIQEEYRSAQMSYHTFHDGDCWPWCHNERFTVPIYSLLDPWLPNRPALDGGDWRSDSQNPFGEMLPNLVIDRGIDASFDFSVLRAPEGTLKFPVLDPIQIRLDFEKVRPPPFDQKDVDVPTLPALPPLPEIDKEEVQWYPEISEEGDSPPSITFELLSEEELEEINDIVTEISGIINSMDNEYYKYWRSQTRWSYKNPPPYYGAVQDCYNRDSENCVHAEMDLLERLMRLGSRPAVLLTDDFLSMGDWRPNPAMLDPQGYPVGYGRESCPEEDWACQLLNQKIWYPRQGWSIEWPAEGMNADEEDGDPIEQLRVDLFEKTLQRTDIDEGKETPDKSGDKGLFPYNARRNDIVPSLGIPFSFPLIADPKEEEGQEEDSSS